MPIASINEPGFNTQGMAPGSVNEPPVLPPSVLKPTVTAIVPNTCPVGGADIVANVTGTGFFSGTVCYVGALVRQTVFNPGDGSLSVTLKPSQRTPGTYQVYVRNGQYSSNSVPFVFT